MNFKQELLDNELNVTYALGQIKKLTIYLDDIPQLSNKQRKFAFYFCINNFDKLDAYEKAGYTYKTDNNPFNVAGASQVYKSKNVQESIKRIIGENITVIKSPIKQRLADYWYRRAFYDLADFFNEDNTVKKLNTIPVQWRKACLDSLEMKYYGKDANTKVTTIKLPDRDKALNMLNKYVQFIEPTNTVNNTTVNNNQFQVSKEAESQLMNVFEIADGL